MRILLAAAVSLSLLVANAFAFDGGTAIGAAAPSAPPAFDQTGTLRSLDKLKGERGQIVAFTRSAVWCPFCVKQMAELEAIKPQIEKRGVRLVVITTDPPEELRAAASKRKLTYTLLSDSGLPLIEAFGVRDPNIKPHKLFIGLPIPSLFFIDSRGIVRAKLGDENYKVRPTGETVLQTLDRALGD